MFELIDAYLSEFGMLSLVCCSLLHGELLVFDFRTNAFSLVCRR